jgi:hypothetical protein
MTRSACTALFTLGYALIAFATTQAHRENCTGLKRRASTSNLLLLAIAKNPAKAHVKPQNI